MHDGNQPAPAGRTSETELSVFVGSVVTTRGERMLACALAAALLVSFGVSVPFASRPLTPYPAFAPIYDVAVVVVGVEHHLVGAVPHRAECDDAAEVADLLEGYVLLAMQRPHERRYGPGLDVERKKLHRVGVLP